MVRSSGIRDKLRSDVLKELARERGKKRPKEEQTNQLEDSSSFKKRKDSDDEDNDNNSFTSNKQDNHSDTIKSTNSLLSILPKPKNSSSFGPTIRIDKLLQLQDRADDALNAASINAFSLNSTKDSAKRVGEDGMIEVDVSKVVGEIDTSSIKELTVEKTNPSNVIVPRGKEKQKNQITYLAQLGKATELERKEQAATSRVNKAAARSKYGW